MPNTPDDPDYRVDDYQMSTRQQQPEEHYEGDQVTLFDDDTDDSLPRPMAGPSEETSRLIGSHLAEREAQGREPSWPDWDE